MRRVISKTKKKRKNNNKSAKQNKIARKMKLKLFLATQFLTDGSVKQLVCV